jgi:serine/threonine protein kinase
MNSIPSIPFRKQPEVSSKERRHEDFVYNKIEPREAGSYKSCWKASFKKAEFDSDRLVAIVKQRFSENETANVFHEIAVHAHLSGHPSIVNVQYSIFLKSRKENHFKWIQIQDLYDGHLEQAISLGLLSANMINCYFTLYSLVEGLVYIHSKGVVLVDIKAKNILYRVDVYGRILTVFTDMDGAFLNGKSPDPKCTPRYKAPEVKTNDDFTPLSDVWSLGAVFGLIRFDNRVITLPLRTYEDDLSDDRLITAIIEFSSTVSCSPWRSIVQRMLEWETTVRFTSNQALEAFKQINNDHFKSYASI